MFIKLRPDATLVAIDINDEQNGETLFFTKDKKSVISSLDFLDAYTLFSGYFTKTETENIIRKLYNDSSIKINEWFIDSCVEVKEHSIWGEPLNKFSKCNIADMNVVFNGTSTVALDIIIMLLKYGVKGVYVKNNRVISIEDVEKSVFLGCHHINYCVDKILLDFCNKFEVKLLDNINLEQDSYISISDELDNISDYCFSVSEYRKIGSVCSHSPFKIETTNEAVLNFMIAFNVHNDVLLAINNGTVE